MKSILSIFIISVCVGAYFIYIKPLSADIKVLNVKKTEYNDVLNRVKEIKEKRDQLLSQYDNISLEDLDKLNKIIPESINSVILLNNLNNVGSKYGIAVKDYKVTEPNIENVEVVVAENPNEIYKTNKVTMTITGQYHQFLAFIDEMESSLTLFDIVSLNIKPVLNQGVGANVMDYVLEANVYSLR